MSDVQVLANDENIEVTVNQPSDIAAIGVGVETPSPVVQQQDSNVIVVDNGTPIKIIQVVTPTNIAVGNLDPIKVVEVAGGPPGPKGDQGPVGPEGPQGPQGVGTAFSATAGTILSGGFAVVMIDGLIYPADPTDITHADRMIGISGNAAQEGAQVQVIQIGLLEGESYPAANVPLYVGLNGMLSVDRSAPGAVWTMRVGTTKDTSSLVVLLQPAIQIA